MPPWQPEPGYGEFLGNRRLSDAQLHMFQQWADDGFQRGDDRDLPSPPQWSHGWQLGDPDLVLTMPAAYPLAKDGADVFRTFVMPVPLSRRRYVRALELDPGAFAAVHHANIKVDPTPLSRRLDEEEPGPGYDGGGSREARFPDGNFLGWTPGQSPRVEPVDTAWRLDPGDDLVVEVHLMPTGRAERIQLRVALYFTDQPPVRVPYILRIGREDIDIPAGEQRYVNTDSFTLPVDVDVLAIQAHAHYLAREIQGFATLPDGTRKWLVFIRNWDFHWQDVYRLAAPLPLPSGATLTMTYTYDNSTQNRHNPNRPPRRVTYRPDNVFGDGKPLGAGDAAQRTRSTDSR